MVKHVILWKLKDDIEDKEKVKAGIKNSLEALKGVVPGLIDIQVIYDCLKTSNAEVLLDSTLESEQALADYAVHPEHVKAADTYVRPYTDVRMCMDYEV